jgi:hypothetical protein
MSFDFAVNDSTSTDTTTTEDTEVSPDFESNEVAEIYISAGDWKATLGAMLEALDLETLKIYSDDTLEDVSRLLGEYSEAHPQQKLHMVASLLKSTAGKMQRDNDHAIGFSDGKAPEEHFEESVSYALYFADLPSITWDDLDGGERESLEEMGIDPSELGFDTTYGGPKILTINGQRLPIAVEEGNEVMEALELLQQIPDEPSAWTEDGLRESSDPSVFGDADTDKVAEEDDEEVEEVDTDEVNLAANPEAIKSFNVGEIRSGVTDITNLRAIQTMLRVESDSENPRSSAIQRLKERRNALRGDGDDDEADETDTEADEEASDDDSEDSVEAVEGLSDSEMNLASTLIETGKADDLEDAAKQIRSL